MLKKLRANPIAQYQLKIAGYRVLYNVDETAKLVTVALIGEKRGNELIVKGKAFHAHKDNRH